ncbi:MAG TPA: threonine/serine dehydratase [Woeseiaceae bacterium]|nr:threonine/serine dehydratase [Woeseiaceae bacterium]
MTAGFLPLDAIGALRTRLATWLVETPVMRCPNLEKRVRGSTEIYAKLEFLQQTGSFKPRGALSVLLGLDADQLARGVTAVSAGNHAIATAFAARKLGTSATVVMPRHASAIRIRACRELGAKLVLADDVHSAFAEAEAIRDKEGRYLVHPFEGPGTVAGTGTIGLELCDQLEQFDTVIVPVGGGGLCAGISAVVKQLRPDCRIYGVEPTGADSMHRSFKASAPVRLEKVNTIADSLGAPYALPYSYALCKAFVEDIVLVTDQELRRAMGTLFRELRIAVEPACAASTAALLGPLSGRQLGRRVVLILCGSNIDWSTYARDAELGLPRAA